MNFKDKIRRAMLCRKIRTGVRLTMLRAEWASGEKTAEKGVGPKAKPAGLTGLPLACLIKPGV